MKSNPSHIDTVETLFSFVEKILYPQAQEESRKVYGNDEPDAVFEALYSLGNATLPGYLSRTTKGGLGAEERLELVRGLNSAPVLREPVIAAWFATEADSCPAITNYIIALECLRLMALEYLTSR
jgi:hypothetical protein